MCLGVSVNVYVGVSMNVCVCVCVWVKNYFEISVIRLLYNSLCVVDIWDISSL